MFLSTDDAESCPATRRSARTAMHAVPRHFSAPIGGGVLWPILIGPADELKFIHITWLAVKLTRREASVAPQSMLLL